MADRLPAKPQIAVDGARAAATPEEAAAAIAAVERFLRDHARPQAPSETETLSGWVRAAREEAIERL